MAQHPVIQIVAPIRLGPGVVSLARIDRDFHLATAAAALEAAGELPRARRGHALVPAVVEDPDGDVLHSAEPARNRRRGDGGDGGDLFRMADREFEGGGGAGGQARCVDPACVRAEPRCDVVHERRERVRRPAPIPFLLRRHDDERKVGKRLQDAGQALAGDEREIAAPLARAVEEQDDRPVGAAPVLRREVEKVTQARSLVRGLAGRRG